MSTEQRLKILSFILQTFLILLCTDILIIVLRNIKHWWPVFLIAKSLQENHRYVSY